MALALDTATVDGGVTGTSLTFAHTCTGTNLILIVGIALDANPGAGDVLSGVTYNGVAMTQIAKRNTSNATFTNRWGYLYYLINPATGANNVVATTSASTNIRGAASSYTGAKQTGQPDASTTNATASATSLATALVTVADNSWMVSFAICVLQTPDASTNVTSRGEAINFNIGDSNGAITPAGSFSMTWTGTTDSFNVLQASIAPAIIAEGGGTPLRSMMGVGA